MIISLIRTVILYVFITASMRLMGKRQVGEMQPAELVITILISAVASVPMQDTELPLIHGIIPIAVLISAEILVSYFSLKFPALRRLLSGRTITLIRNGIIDQKALTKLRISTDDLLEDLRLKDVYDLRKIRLAQIETNGRLSVLLDNRKTPPCAEDLDIRVRSELPFEAIISDGKTDRSVLEKMGKNDDWLYSVIKERGAESPSDVFLLCADENGEIIFAKKEQTK